MMLFLLLSSNWTNFDSSFKIISFFNRYVALSIIRNQDKVYRLAQDLHKIHKPNAPLRPILLTTNSYTYSLSLSFSLNFLCSCCIRYVKANILSVPLSLSLGIYSVLKTMTMLWLALILCPYSRVFQWKKTIIDLLARRSIVLKFFVLTLKSYSNVSSTFVAREIHL